MTTHRLVGAGYRSHGRAIAKAIKGMPRHVGDANWSKKLSIMVRFRWVWRLRERLELRVH